MANHSKVNFSYFDYSRERSTVSIRGGVLAEAALTAAQVALRAALDAVTLDIPVQETAILSVVDNRDTDTEATDPYAQRESKWLCVGKGADGTSFSCEVPLADLTLVDNNGEMDIDAGAGAALKAALEGYATTKSGSAVTISKIVHVGRNT